MVSHLREVCISSPVTSEPLSVLTLPDETPDDTWVELVQRSGLWSEGQPHHCEVKMNFFFSVCDVKFFSAVSEAEQPDFLT